MRGRIRGRQVARSGLPAAHTTIQSDASTRPQRPERPVQREHPALREPAAQARALARGTPCTPALRVKTDQRWQTAASSRVGGMSCGARGGPVRTKASAPAPSAGRRLPSAERTEGAVGAPARSGLDGGCAHECVLGGSAAGWPTVVSSSSGSHLRVNMLGLDWRRSRVLTKSCVGCRCAEKRVEPPVWRLVVQGGMPR